MNDKSKLLFVSPFTWRSIAKCITIVHSGQWILFIAQYRVGLNFFFLGGGGGGGGGGDLNILRIYTDAVHASNKRLVAKIGLDLVGSLLPQISM